MSASKNKLTPLKIVETFKDLSEVDIRNAQDETVFRLTTAFYANKDGRLIYHAKFIVGVCNMHQDLVAALKRTQNQMASIDWDETTHKMVDAVLAKADAVQL